MAVCTLQAHVSRALDFYNKSGLYFGIGKTSKWSASDVPDFDSERDYDIRPPAPKNTDILKEILGYKRVEFKSLVVQDDSGSLEYRNVKWKVVKPEDAVLEGARWVYLSAGLAYDELPADLPYRAVGVFSGLVPVEGTSEALYALTPIQVKDSGLLEVIDFRRPVYRDVDVRERIKIILEF